MPSARRSPAPPWTPKPGRRPRRPPPRASRPWNVSARGKAMAFARAKALKRFFRETWYMLPVSLILALIIEFLNHHTPEKLILFLSGHPWMFLFNVEIIFNTFLFAELF